MPLCTVTASGLGFEVQRLPPPVASRAARRTRDPLAPAPARLPRSWVASADVHAHRLADRAQRGARSSSQRARAAAGQRRRAGGWRPGSARAGARHWMGSPARRGHRQRRRRRAAARADSRARAAGERVAVPSLAGSPRHRPRRYSVARVANRVPCAPSGHAASTLAMPRRGQDHVESISSRRPARCGQVGEPLAPLGPLDTRAGSMVASSKPAGTRNTCSRAQLSRSGALDRSTTATTGRAGNSLAAAPARAAFVGPRASTRSRMLEPSGSGVRRDFLDSPLELDFVYEQIGTPFVIFLLPMRSASSSVSGVHIWSSATPNTREPFHECTA